MDSWFWTENLTKASNLQALDTRWQISSQAAPGSAGGL